MKRIEPEASKPREEETPEKDLFAKPRPPVRAPVKEQQKPASLDSVTQRLAFSNQVMQGDKTGKKNRNKLKKRRREDEDKNDLADILGEFGFKR